MAARRIGGPHVITEDEEGATVWNQALCRALHEDGAMHSANAEVILRPAQSSGSKLPPRQYW